MYVHLGGNIIINSRDIIGWFDIDRTTVSKTTRNFLKKAQEDGGIIHVNVNELPKTFILTGKRKGKTQVYLSNLTVQTLIKRSREESIKEEGEEDGGTE